MKKIFILSLAFVMSLTASTTFAMKPVTIEDQGSLWRAEKLLLPTEF